MKLKTRTMLVAMMVMMRMGGTVCFGSIGISSETELPPAGAEDGMKRIAFDREDKNNDNNLNNNNNDNGNNNNNNNNDGDSNSVNNRNNGGNSNNNNDSNKVNTNNTSKNTDPQTDPNRSKPLKRTKRQFTYLALSFMGPQMIRDFVRNTKTEAMGGLMDLVGPDEILYIVSCLEEDEIVRVMTAMPPKEILRLSRLMTSEQLTQLLSYVPPYSMATMTQAFSPKELEQLVVMLSPELIINMTKAMPADLTLKMIRSMPPDAVVNMTLGLAPDELEQLMRAVPPESMLSIITALPPPSIRELISNMPPGFIESFTLSLTPNELGRIVGSMTAEQAVKMMTSFPLEHAPNVSSLLKPEIIGAVLDSLPRDFVGNMTSLLTPRNMTAMITTIPKDILVQVSSLVTPRQMVDMVSSIPPKAMTTLVESMPVDIMLTLATSMSVDKIVNVSIALAELDPKILSGIIGSMMNPNLVKDLSASFPPELVLEIMEKLPKETIGKFAAALPVRKAFGLLKPLSSQFSGLNMTKMMNEIPKDLLQKLMTSVPPEVIANMSKQLTPNQMKKLFRMLTPEMMKLSMTLMPPKLMVDVAFSLPESVMAMSLKVLSPNHFRELIESIPMDVMQKVMAEALSEKRGGFTKQEMAASAQKIVTILNSVPPEKITRLIKAIPRDFLVQVIDSMPAKALARGAAMMAGEEHGALLAAALPVEAAAYTVSIIPPRTIIKVMDAIPSSTIAAFGRQALKIPQPVITQFFQLIEVGTIKTIITGLPPRIIRKMVTSIPPEVVGKMTRSFSPVSVTPFMESLKPRDLTRLIRAVNTSVLTSLMTSVPQDFIVNVMLALPASQLDKMMSAVPPDVIAQMVTLFDPDAMVVMMKAIPSAVVQNMMTSMPTDLLINMTRLLPPAALQQLIDVLPDAVIGQMVSIMPADVMTDLVQAFDPAAMLNMIQRLEPSQLMGIMGKMPHKALLDMTTSLTSEQMMTLMSSIPPEGMVNMTRMFPSDVMMDMMEAVPPEAMIGMMTSMTLKDLFAFANQLTPEQMTKAMEHFVSDPDFIPNLMDSIDLDRLVSMTEAVPLDLLLQVGGRVNVVMLQDLLGRLKPKVKAMLEEVVERGLAALDVNSTNTWHTCLKHSGVVARHLFNFSEWAFHFLDASGKPGRGMLEGNIHMIGNFDQCKRIRFVPPPGAPQSDVITGSYCHVQFDIPLEQLPPIPGDGMLPMPEIAMDLCLPASCKDVDIHKLLLTVPLPLNITIPRVSCQQDSDITQDPAALLACAIILSLLFIIIVATIIDVLNRRRYLPNGDNNNYNNKYTMDATTFQRYSTPPSLVACRNNSARCTGSGDGDGDGGGRGLEEDICTNEKLLKVPDTQIKDMVHMTVSECQRLTRDKGKMSSLATHTHTPPSLLPSHHAKMIDHTDRSDIPTWLKVAAAISLVSNARRITSFRHHHNNVSCLHGIRVVSMLWVILANTVMFSALYFENLMNAADQLISLPAQVILNSSLAQDTFFVISGVVTALSFFKWVKVGEGVSAGDVVYYYLHRLVRVWPAYILVLMVCACLLGNVADGPHWPPVLQQQCKEQWWTNLLFINNYFVSIEHMCMSWTWFLANLMQFYWLAPVALLPWAFGQKLVGFLMVAVCVAVHIVFTVVLEININGDILRRQSDYLWTIYQQPYCRVAPYAIGLALGFVLTRLNSRFYINKVTSYICWILSLSVSAIIVFITYDENQHLLTDASGWSHTSRVLHETLQRPLWALIVSWVIFACATGNGGNIGKIFSWRGFLPVSRLSYSVYLVHPVLILCDLLAYRVFPYFTLTYVIFRYISYVVVAYLLALLLALIAEWPVLSLETVFMSSRRRQRA